MSATEGLAASGLLGLLGDVNPTVLLAAVANAVGDLGIDCTDILGLGDGPKKRVKQQRVPLSSILYTF